ncbi:MAG: hypothetical protein AB8B69_18130 [Chitinophagales bacterium]
MFTNKTFVTKWASAFLFLTFLAVGFSSCEKDDDTPTTTIIVTCPGDVTSGTNDVSIAIPNVSGAVGNFTLTNDVTNISDASGTYANGTTTVTYTVTDDTTGEVATCSFDVTVDNGLTIEEETIGGTAFNKVTGSLTGNYTMTADKSWLISGGIFVDAGATLSIEAGTTIYAADDGATAFLAVQRGGKIMAEGTSTAPIVLTSIKSLDGIAGPGDWGGVIINGYATTNIGEGVGEGGTGTYGCDGSNCNDADNSGVIRYVRVEYAGKILGTDNELNGFSFNGVGNGTTVEYIQAFSGSDDGIEFFGGTVNVKYAVSSGNEDDSFDWTFGWSGNGQFWVAHQFGVAGDRGLEADNNGDDNTASPYSNPTLSNITLVGFDDGDGSNTGMRLREGTKGKIYNAIVTGFPGNGIRVSNSDDDDASTVTTDNMNNGELVVANSVSAGNDTAWKDCDVFENDATNTTLAGMGGLNGYVGTIGENAKDPGTLGVWFSPASFIGAVRSTEDWTAGWTKQ